MPQLLERTSERHVSDTAASPRARRRWPALVAALTLAVGAIGMIGAGAAAAIMSVKGDYVDLGARGDYRTDGYALVTDATDWRDTLFGFAGSVRVEVASADDQPIFVGVAAPAELRRYLAGVDSTTVHEREGGVVRTSHDGSAPAMPAAAAISWTAHAQGAATETVRWNATQGRQAVVAMHADGSRPLHVRIVSSAVTLDRMPWWLPTAALAFGSAMLALAVLLMRRALRRHVPT